LTKTIGKQIKFGENFIPLVVFIKWNEKFCCSDVVMTDNLKKVITQFRPMVFNFVCL
jgi:hypothetical protein